MGNWVESFCRSVQGLLHSLVIKIFSPTSNCEDIFIGLIIAKYYSQHILASYFSTQRKWYFIFKEGYSCPRINENIGAIQL